MKIETFLDYRTILANQARPVHFAIRFEAENNAAPRPVSAAFCAVLDRSGSMSGEPLQRAKEAAQIAVRNLRTEDQFSLVVFDSSAQTLIPLQKASDKEKWLKLIGDIQSGGSTNLAGGWTLGRDELKKTQKEASRRLLLLSDGHLNVGIVDPALVGQLVSAGLENDAIRTSCLGFGDNYNEDLMNEMARTTGGQFYDAASAEKLPGIFASELDGLQKISAQNLRVRFRRLDFCDAAELLGNYPVVQLPDGRSEISVGDLVSGETRVLCFALGVLPLPAIEGKPAFSVEGEPLIEVEFLFDEIGEKEVTSKTITQLVRIQATQNPADVKMDEQVVSWVAMQKAGRTLEEVTGNMDKGQSEEACFLLEKTIYQLNEYGPAEHVQEATRVLENLKQKITTRQWDARQRKSSRYTSHSLRKMSSAEMWSGLAAEEPSFKKPRPEPPSSSENKSGDKQE